VVTKTEHQTILRDTQTKLMAEVSSHQRPPLAVCSLELCRLSATLQASKVSDERNAFAIQACTLQSAPFGVSLNVRMGPGRQHL